MSACLCLQPHNLTCTCMVPLFYLVGTSPAFFLSFSFLLSSPLLSSFPPSFLLSSLFMVGIGIGVEERSFWVTHQVMKSQCQSKLQHAMFLFGHYISWAKWSRNEYWTWEAEDGKCNTRPTKKQGSPASPLPQGLRVLEFELGTSQSPFNKRYLLLLHFITSGYVLCKGTWTTSSSSAQPVVEHSVHSFSNSTSILTLL